MKQLAIFNVTRNQLDNIFEKGHKGIPVSDMVDKAIDLDGFALYKTDDGDLTIKIVDKDGRDYFTYSQVFIKNLMEYLKTVDDNDFPTTIHVTSEKSKKGGKTYYSIKEAINSNSTDWRSLTF